MKTPVLLLTAILFSAGIASADQHTPYAGEEQGEIKALSAEEVKGYLAGKGAGMAKAAERNHSPGPAHVLEHADALRMTQSQRESTGKILSGMRNEAMRLGEAVVGRDGSWIGRLHRVKSMKRLFAPSLMI